MAYLAVLTLGHGRREGFAATLGIALGLAIVGVAAALGLAALISSSVLLYETLRWGGFAYLIWLAWVGWQGAAETSPGRPLAEELTQRSSRAVYRGRYLSNARSSVGMRRRTRAATQR